mmetsp:Transcript_124607/g.360431  ORF Transcript_124607/g.360431 Transcript_124607/m.360431 type:complete len:544 (-) Transcript_124607:185-1816(-)
MGHRCGKEQRRPWYSPADGCAEGNSIAASASEGSQDSGSSQERLPQKRGTREFLVSHRNSNPGEEYDVGDKAGEGMQGVVFQAMRKKTGVMRAIKKVPKNKFNPRHLELEIEIMQKMDHPNIVKLFETIHDRRNTYFVMELCEGGELFDRIVAQGHFNELSTAIVLQQMLRAVHYMHERHIAHRDLKPENFMFHSKGPIDEANPLKLIDFGLAVECPPGTILKEVVGTPLYVAPQVISKKYDKMCDLWSCGVIMYALLSGNVPFNGPSNSAVLAKVREGIVRYRAPEWANVSRLARDLAEGLLKRNPRERMTASAALDHEWIKHLAPGGKAELQDGLVERLDDFRRKNKLKQAALTIVANELSEKQISGLRDSFTVLDTNMDGLLTYNEIKLGVEKAGFEVSDDLMKRFEGNMDDVIDYTEFIAATLDRKRHLSDEAIRVAFGVFDSEGQGKVTTKDIAKFFADSHDRGGHRAKAAKDVLRRYAKKGANSMDFDDFRKMMHNDASPMERSPNIDADETLPNVPQSQSDSALLDRFEAPSRRSR